MLKLEPVRRAAAPRYPTSLEDLPDLLQALPERWRGNPLVSRVLGGAVALLLASPLRGADPPARSHVAPIFVHGDARGAFGCEVVNPPVFLSEDEAKQVIQDEARRAGLSFEPDVLRLSRPNGKPTRVVIGGYDRAHKVAFALASHRACLEQMSQSIRSTVYECDYRAVAEELRRQVSGRTSPPWVGIFYTPGSQGSASPDWSKARDAATRQNATDLRKQVRDFLAWLKAQGVI